MLTLAREYNIGVAFYPTPTMETGIGQTRRTLAAVRRLGQNHPDLSVRDDAALTYPDDFFYDGTHLNAKGRRAILPVLNDRSDDMFLSGISRILQRKNDAMESMVHLDLRDKLNQTPLFTLSGFYSLEGRGDQALRWRGPTFQIGIPASNPLQSLVIETAPHSPACSLALTFNGQTRSP